MVSVYNGEDVVVWKGEAGVYISSPNAENLIIVSTTIDALTLIDYLKDMIAVQMGNDL